MVFSQLVIPTKVENPTINRSIYWQKGKDILKKKIFSCYLKIKNLLISMTEFHKIHLMDVITYKGQRCFVNNGTKCDSNGNRLWDILPEELDENGKRSGWSVQRSEFKRVFCWFNIKNALFSRYDWWKKYWYNIQLREMMSR